MPATIRQLSFTLNIEKAAAIIAYLDAKQNRTEAIRRALRRQMKEEEA